MNRPLTLDAESHDSCIIVLAKFHTEKSVGMFKYLNMYEKPNLNIKNSFNLQSSCDKYI